MLGLLRRIVRLLGLLRRVRRLLGRVVRLLRLLWRIIVDRPDCGSIVRFVLLGFRFRCFLPRLLVNATVKKSNVLIVANSKQNVESEHFLNTWSFQKQINY